MTTMKLLIAREKEIDSYRYKIGYLCNEIVEDPQAKLSNLTILIKLMKEKNSVTSFTVQKLATASLLEVFKDILPSFNIKIFKKFDIKRKLYLN